jgi:hypothetical protein
MGRSAVLSQRDYRRVRNRRCGSEPSRNGIAWLADKLALHDQGLEAGHLVLAGSFTRTVPARAGDTFMSTTVLLAQFPATLSENAEMNVPINRFKRAIRAAARFDSHPVVRLRAAILI